MSNPVLCLHLIIYQFFNEVKLKCLSYLLSAENTCKFNNNKLFKKFKEKLPDSMSYYMYTCIGSWENGNCYPPYQDVAYTSSHRSHQKLGSGKGVQEEAISKRLGSDSQRLSFQGLWKKSCCFYWWSYINSYS